MKQKIYCILSLLLSITICSIGAMDQTNTEKPNQQSPDMCSICCTAIARSPVFTSYKPAYHFHCEDLIASAEHDLMTTIWSTNADSTITTAYYKQALQEVHQKCIETGYPCIKTYREKEGEQRLASLFAATKIAAALNPKNCVICSDNSKESLNQYNAHEECQFLISAAEKNLVAFIHKNYTKFGRTTADAVYTSALQAVKKECLRKGSLSIKAYLEKHGPDELENRFTYDGQSAATEYACDHKLIGNSPFEAA